MPSATVTHAGLWGYFTDTWVFLWGSALAASKVVPAAATFELPIADLDLLADLTKQLSFHVRIITYQK
jgi:hypothetical protein